MRTITEDEAKFLRELRLGLLTAIRSMQNRLISVKVECGHEIHDKNCPLCDIYAKAQPENYFDTSMMEFANTIDAHLQRGPAPV